MEAIHILTTVSRSLPLALSSLGLLCSIAGIFIVKSNAAKSPEKALRLGTMGSSIIFIVLAYFLISQLGLNWGIWVAVLSGAVGGIIIGLERNIILLGLLFDILQSQVKPVLRL